ncbi:P-loop containing nucleoside triphosphate hydrolase protein, partial [Schizophyllum amplum]
GNIHTVSDLLLTSTQDISKRCRLTPIEIADLVDVVRRDYVPDVRPLSQVIDRLKTWTTADARLDAALGGGMRTGMLWEVVGESAAGKTQLALQLSLSVQLPVEKGGLGGSCCYIKTSAKLPTGRLREILHEHLLLSTDDCSLDDVHTMSIPTIPGLLAILTTTLPKFIQDIAATPSRKPVKLLVVDALGELFHAAGRTTSQTLVERARHLTEISVIFHTLASLHGITVLVLNEVIEAIDRPRAPGLSTEPFDLLYSEQSRFFSRADTVPGENQKEASLGLVWANQVNARIMLTRTNRRRPAENIAPRKRARTSVADSRVPSDEAEGDDPLRIRRLSVIFSSVGSPISMDYVVTGQGVLTLAGIEGPVASLSTAPRAIQLLTSGPPAVSQEPHAATDTALRPEGIVPLDVGYARFSQEATEDESFVEEGPDAEEEQMWASTAEAMPDDLYSLNIP